MGPGRACAVFLLLAQLDASGLAAAQEVRFVASTPALGYATRRYESIWDQNGTEIVAALEARTCLPFSEPIVTAIVADATSHSGGPEHPMRLRASYNAEAKRSTLVHELGHRHLWQLPERLDGIDGHQTLFLVLDLVWEDVWGKEFSDRRVLGESRWRSDYDYAAAWQWARSLATQERRLLWRALLELNGIADTCG